jgi:LL-H family phage holin
MMNDITFMVLKIVISICAALITVYVIPYLRTLRSDKRYSSLIDMVRVAVLAAEQTITGEKQGSVKKEAVVEFVRDWMQKQGLDITYEQLSQLIEAAVYSMKQEAK